MNIENIPFTCPTLTLSVYDANTILFHNNAINITADTCIDTLLKSEHSKQTVLLMYKKGSNALQLVTGNFAQFNIPSTELTTILRGEVKTKKVFLKPIIHKHREVLIDELEKTTKLSCFSAVSHYESDQKRVIHDNPKKFSSYHPIVPK